MNDPPTAYGFNYKMTSDSLFTSILDWPSNFVKPFNVLVGDILLGQFTAGDSIDFSQYEAQLGSLLVNGTGVKEFKITGIDVDPNNPTAFPIKLASNTDLMSFDLQALLNPDAVDGGGVGGGGSESVPEPSTILSMLVSGLFFRKVVQKRKQLLATKESA